VCALHSATLALCVVIAFQQPACQLVCAFKREGVEPSVFALGR
jgi:hypothetical protein